MDSDWDWGAYPVAGHSLLAHRTRIHVGPVLILAPSDVGAGDVGLPLCGGLHRHVVGGDRPDEAAPLAGPRTVGGEHHFAAGPQGGAGEDVRCEVAHEGRDVVLQWAGGAGTCKTAAVRAQVCVPENFSYKKEFQKLSPEKYLLERGG